MTKGDIVRMPSGAMAQYIGGTDEGARFVYLTDEGTPRKHRGEPDTFHIASIRLLARLQPEYARV